jgi:hypothetical protein
VIVAGRIHRLWQIDDHRAIASDQNVVFAQVAVHDARAQHPHDFPDQAMVMHARHVGRELEIIETRGGLPVFIGDELHVPEPAFEDVVLPTLVAACAETRQRLCS